MIQKTVFFCFALFLISFSQAQVEVNVKLSPGYNDLQAFLASQSGQINPIESIPATLSSRFPFVNNLNQVTALRLNESLEDIFTLSLNEPNTQITITTLKQSGAFEFVEENHIRSLHQLNYQPNDDSLTKQWFHNYIQTPQAWDLTTGSASVKIGFLDTGIDFLHPEFIGQLAINSFEDLNQNGKLDPWPQTEVRNGISGDYNGIDEDNNGYIDDVCGYDFVDQPRSPFGGDYLFADANPMDDNGHGTAIAGIIGAKADNTIGGSGVAPGCRMVPIRAFAANGSGEDDDIARAIVYAVDNGIKILNFSFGDIYPSQIMHEAIKYAYDHQVIMVASAGNGTGDELHYPSAFNEVISISASAADLSNGNEFLWPLSSYGVTVDLCAPGSRIFTTTLLDTSSTGKITQFITTQGTSTSAPMVAATVGLLFSHQGFRSPQQVRGLL
ncbi:MAG: S8 family serine peptidase, partial [Bacteroidetes bacterium]|nr:S8 family serine peptidase [Bacteroidota bacterium]